MSFLLLAAPSGALPADADRLSPLPRWFVREFRFEGNTVFSDAELGGLVRPWTNREVTAVDLEEARRAVTLHYIRHGFINSGAVLPEAEPSDGIMRVRIIEGVLSRIHVRDNRWLRESYLRARIQTWGGPPLNVSDLREGLHVLRQDPNIEEIHAELKPGVAPGESVLDVRVKETLPFRLGLQFDNQRPSSVGGEEVLLHVAHRNLTGHGDTLQLTYGIAHANGDPMKFSVLDNVSGSYAFPLTARDTTLSVHGGKQDFAVIEEPFASLDITSESHSFGVWLRHPLHRSAGQEWAVAAGFERRESQTYLLGKPFTVSPGAVKGRSELSVLRLSQEWTHRSQEHVLALRSTLSVGVDAFGTTDDGSSRDAKFVAWLGQVRYVQRLFGTGNQLILRATGHGTLDPLLSLEQFSLGGFHTVRGYRENQLVRDRGVFGSAELRLPLLHDKRGRSLAEVAPFVDWGAAENADGKQPEPRHLGGAGVGLILTPCRHWNSQLYWAHGFRNFDSNRGDLQDIAIHFRLNVELF